MEPIDLPATDRTIGASAPDPAAFGRVVQRGRALQARRRLAIAGGVAGAVVVLAASSAAVATRRTEAPVVEAGAPGGPAVGPPTTALGGAAGSTGSTGVGPPTTAAHPTPGSIPGNGGTTPMTGPPTTSGPVTTATTALTVPTQPPPTTAPSGVPASQPTLPHSQPTTPPTVPGKVSIPEPDGIGTAHLLAVAISRVGDSDRVTFTLDAEVGVDVEYVDGPIEQDGSGAPVEVAGGAYLKVRFFRASGYDMEQGAPTYTGPKRVGSGGTGADSVTEAVATGDFEGVLTWVIGVDQTRAFGVTAVPTNTGGTAIEITL